MFPGDAIYAGPMFAHNDYGDPVAYRKTLRRLAELADDVDVVYPSHNRVPLAPADVQAMHKAYEEIFEGREPDESTADYDVYAFGEFSFWMPPGYEAAGRVMPDGHQVTDGSMSTRSHRAVWSIAEPGHVEQVHSYLIEGERDVAVLDTGMGVGDFRGLVRELSDRDPLVVQSHAHWDHIGASSRVRARAGASFGGG